MLEFKNPKDEELKKILIYGQDGSGKSTFASQYCKENGLTPVVIDIDDTNRTNDYYNGHVLNLEFKNSLSAFNKITEAINEIANTTDFDTIIIDGVTSLLELLVSNAKGLKKYADRAERFQAIIRALIASKKNIIFIGQIDMEVIYNEEFQSSKMVIKVNSLVNEKYYCSKVKNDFKVDVVKYRSKRPQK